MTKKELIRKGKKLERRAKKELARTSRALERRAKKELARAGRTMERRAKVQWKDLSKGQRTAIVAGAVVQLTLLAAAQIDIARRPAEEIRGSKWLWRILTLVNFIGPLAYFAFGRKRATTTPETGGEAAEIVAA
jgi:hypothetical protein